MPNALTELACKNAAPPTAGQIMLWDGSLKGFGLRLSQGGSKTFIVLIGSGRRQTIGRYPVISLADARSEAKRILAEKQLGKVRPASVPFDDAKVQFLADCACENRPKTVKDYTWLFKFFPFGRTSVGDITPREILFLLKALNDRPVQKRYAFAVLRAFFKWAVQHHIVDRSPMEAMKTPPKSGSRERVLSDDELRALICHLNAPTWQENPFKRICLLLAYTGQRRGEIAALEWSWISEDAITFPKWITKNGITHTIPLTSTVKDILAQIPKLSDKYVFPTARQRSEKTTVFNGWSKPKAELNAELVAIDAKMVTNWTLHDLRRTFATGMQRLGVRLEVTEALLNHTSGSQDGVVGIYQKYHWYPEKLDALTKWETFLATLETHPQTP